MDGTGIIMQAAAPIVVPTQNNYQSYEVPNSSAYTCMMPPVNSDPCHVVNQASLGMSMELHMHPALNDLLLELSSNQLQDICEAQKRKQELHNHRLQPVLYEVLKELKEKSVLAREKQQLAIDEEPDNNKLNAQLMRLDNMLIAEGVAEPNSRCDGATAAVLNEQLVDGPTNGIEHQDYRNKLNKIKEWYHSELIKYEEFYNNFNNNAKTLLREQCLTRPITRSEADKTFQTLQHKIINVQIQLKQQTCEAVMSLRSRFLDARRKRRNFSKQASDILNAYFYSHLHNPYPSEEAKVELARQCDITISQVSNWFGNKRIRYKKNAGKAQEEANMYASKKPAVTMPYQTPTIPPPPATAAPPVMQYEMPSNIQDFYQIPDYSTLSTGYDGLYSQQSSA